jgi:ParB family chromosome partitioning protein
MNPKKKALGRGLSALLDPAVEENTALEGEQKGPFWSIAEIAISQIESNPLQPRTDFEQTALTELAQSIKEQGIIQPVTIRKTGEDKYQLISGERRYRAAQLAGLESIPAYIRTVDDNQLLEMALVENIQRQDLNSIEIAISFQRLLDECSYTQEELSSKVGKNRSTVTNYLRLLRLPAELQVALRDDQISMGHARALINIDDRETQLAILKNILVKKLSVRDVEQIVQNLNKQEPEKPPKKKEELPRQFHPYKAHLESKLSSKFDLRLNNKGKGSLIITIKDEEELRKFMDHFS